MTAEHMKNSSFALMIISFLRCRGMDQRISNLSLILINKKEKLLGIMGAVVISAGSVWYSQIDSLDIEQASQCLEHSLSSAIYEYKAGVVHNHVKYRREA